MGIRLPERLRTDRLSIGRLEAVDDASVAKRIECNLEHLRPWLSWHHAERLDGDERRLPSDDARFTGRVRDLQSWSLVKGDPLPNDPARRE